MDLAQVRKPVREQTWRALANAMRREQAVFASKYKSLKQAMKSRDVERPGALVAMMDRSLELFSSWEHAAMGRLEMRPADVPPPSRDDFEALRELLVDAVAQNLATLRTVQDRVFFRELSGWFGDLSQDASDPLPAPTPKEHQQAEGRVNAALLEGKTIKALALGAALVGVAMWMSRGGRGLSSFGVTDEQYMEAEESFAEEAYDFDQEARAFDPDCNTLRAKLHRMRIYHRRTGRDVGVGRQLQMREGQMKKLCKEPRSRMELNGLGATKKSDRHCVELEFERGGRAIAQCYSSSRKASAVARRMNQIADENDYGFTARRVMRGRQRLERFV